ncbi:aminotransferase class V-fold PLP-dependent enzyme [Bacillus cereus group sp. BfR-BA-01352]|uniref:aminotransferase class V-fold PLP-dependent enzyme n=1 Tax=Bacillus cereus group sp. BfR-BA-01352 TaxID=2920315 RepID=UPI001F57FCC0|nr:aminotransferase class V-fold PLP-dependent enzyme [Bacillus cereus group sp. BfR-BA-01352]
MNFNYSGCVVGNNTQICTNYGCRNRIYFNNGATALILKEVLNKINNLYPFYTYTNVNNYNSNQITTMYLEVKDIIKKYIGADVNKDTVIYVKNATLGINIFANILTQIDKDQVVLTTKMEHMANYLPYAARLKTVLIDVLPDGNIDLEDYKNKLELYKGKIKFVCVTAASNITGIVTPIYTIAKIAHQYSAKIFVDAVQLIQHKPFDMKPHDSPEHIDFLVFSSHKIYSGLDGGALVGPSQFFNQYLPLEYGASISEFVNTKKIILKDSPSRYEAGYPNIVGVIAMGTALKFISRIGINNIERIERSLYKHLLDGLREIPNIILYGTEANASHIPFISFNFKGIHPFTISQILGYDYGIEIASGKNAADIYIQTLFGLTDKQVYELYLRNIDYGVLRVSLGFYNTHEEIDCFLKILRLVVHNIYFNIDNK